jgi:class 3 adenylate cyclase
VKTPTPDKLSAAAGASVSRATAVPQRRTATFLFTDIVGSTERWERDAADMRVALTRHEDLLRASIEASGGEVFKTVGDALHAVFATATAAVEAAVAGTRALSTEDWSGRPVEVRMAVYTGEAEAIDGDWLGRPLNRCARLLAAASGGQILVSNTTARLADSGLPAGVHLVELGTYRFRGVDRAERVFQVVAPGLLSEFGPLTDAAPMDDTSGGHAAAHHDDALPSSLAGHVANRWVGRDGELEILRRAWSDASLGNCRMVLIAGEPGAGKTALATRFATEAAQSGAWVLHGHCDEEALLPYHAVAEALEHLVATAEGSLLAEHTAAHGGDLCSIVPLLARRVPGLQPSTSTTPEADRGRVAMAVIGLLEAGARHRPMVVVLDDLHWADSGTVGLLRELVHRAPSVPLLVVATYRSTDVEREQPSAQLLADLRREPGVARVALVGLSEEEVSELVCGLAGQPFDDDAQSFAASLRRDTGGNPFFIIEVLHHLVETGALEMGDGHWSLDSATVQIPEGIREVVGRRLDRLGAERTQMLRTAAVVGARFDLQVVAAVLAVSEDALLATLEAAGAADLVAEVSGAVDCWQFTHELVRRTLVDQLSLSRRARTHRAVGETLERMRPQELAALANHFAASAGLGDVNRAVEYAYAAADQAAARAGHADAARLL